MVEIPLDSETNETPADDGWLGAFAPASVSNVGPGFDCFGFAIDAPGAVVQVRPTESPGVIIESITGDKGRVPREIDRNSAGTAARTLWSMYQDRSSVGGLALRMEMQMPIASGLGSSAASAVAAAVATMRVIMKETNAPHDENAVLEAALAGEEVASGSRHADNVAPALMGGFTVVQSVGQRGATEHPVITRLEPQLRCRVVVVTPNLEISTKSAREALPEQVPFRDAVRNTANAASLILALLTADEKLLRLALHDHVVEPCRALLIPGYAEARRAALEAGAYGCSISGSGPTVFALCPNQRNAVSVSNAVREVFGRHDLECIHYITSISNMGAREI